MPSPFQGPLPRPPLAADHAWSAPLPRLRTGKCVSTVLVAPAAPATLDSAALLRLPPTLCTGARRSLLEGGGCALLSPPPSLGESGFVVVCRGGHLPCIPARAVALRLAHRGLILTFSRMSFERRACHHSGFLYASVCVFRVFPFPRAGARTHTPRLTLAEAGSRCLAGHFTTFAV